MLGRIIIRLFIVFYALKYFLRKIFAKKNEIKLGFVSVEFFHEDLKGFGGYGMTLKYITEYFNPKGSALKADVILASPLLIQRPEIRHHHQANVVCIPKEPVNQLQCSIDYFNLVDSLNIDALVTVDHYPLYENALLKFPRIPWVIWLKDPRDAQCWEKIATVPLETLANGRKDANDVLNFVKNQKESFLHVMDLSEKFGRKVIVAAEYLTLIDIAQRGLGIEDNLRPVKLSKPIPLPIVETIKFSEKPSFLFLGRLDAIKRPWVFCELAKRFQDYDFFVAGATHMPHIMDRVMAKYQDVPNLKFLGKVHGQKKADLLNHIWGMINTSVHESLPVTFLESFTYGKPVIACRNPNGLTEKFGVYTGEMLGDALDEVSLDKDSQAIKRFLDPSFDRVLIGTQARDYVRREHSFENFENTVRKMFMKQSDL